MEINKLSHLLKISEVAEILSVHRNTVMGLAKQSYKRLPLIKISPRNYRISEEALIGFIEGRKASEESKDFYKSRVEDVKNKKK
ncbi:hypothetical protein LNTAR_25380 [Lentisphaera araneosa HTCC2155]|uniref:Helix-turn-helix domain-containing protein n=1 Tax=Lentisphaera araneosa HTCC2155 TaxID=313628 RepID=A6DSB8_9BACT|nr:helix-turn-helix domain-containing protein [Lentisphaera araneosa]EDM25463.1 hypothetical protein LNTAR_25380 [Lentisphaera araneosa HTCC2155]